MSEQDRRDFLRMAGLSAIAPAIRGSGPQPAKSGSRRPNVLIIMSDQHHAGLTKRSGFPLDTMPTLDRLAESGAGFRNAYACAPLCVPSRVSLLTGRWPHAHRVRQNSAAEHAVFGKDIFDVVKALGYRTGLAGKNHSYLKPSRLDFWRAYTHLGGWKPSNAPRDIVEFDKWLLRENFNIEPQPAPFPAEAQHPYRIVSDACEFMSANPEQPFALWVSFPEPHNPYQVSEPYFSMFPPDTVPPRAVGPEAIAGKGFKWQWLRGLEEDANPGYDSLWRRTRSNYLGMLRLIDDQIKRLLAFLDHNHLRENTLIVYLSDHGDYFCDYGLIHKGVGMPEDLIRIPMVWSGAGVTAGLSPDAFVSTADVLPTFCEALSVEIPHGAQGRSLWPILQNRDYPREEFRSIYSEVGFGGMYYDAADHVPYSVAEFRSSAPDSKLGFDELDKVTQSGNLKMVRMGEWKLYFDMLGNGELYHLPSDPFELTNRFRDTSVAAHRNELLAQLLTWTIRTEDDLPLAAYQTKWPKRNWYALYQRANPPA
ncbi:MAG TPA: sulfatase-like hydrolase/transferase [Bryobacteraceae bacterium]